MLGNNLSSKDGTSFEFAKNLDKGGKLYLYDNKVTDATHDSLQVVSELEAHKSDIISSKYLKVKGTWFLISIHIQSVIIFNHNGTRRLFSYDSGKAFGNENVNTLYFTCCSIAYDKDSGDQFIILGANDGSVH
jgi:hypothetical protein